MSELLTKAKLLQGTEYTEELDLQALGLDRPGKVKIKPLTEGQAANVQALQQQGQTIKLGSGGVTFDRHGNPDLSAMEQEIDLEQQSRKQFEASTLAISYAMSVDEKWTVEDVKNIQLPGFVPTVAAEVMRISGLSKEAREEAHSFRRDTGGEDNLPTA